MKYSAFDATVLRDDYAKPGKINEMSKKFLFNQLSLLESGALTIKDNVVSRSFGRHGAEFPLSASVRVHHPRFFTRVLTGGVIGAAESYMDGDWITDDLAALCRILARNGAALSGVDRKLRFIAEPTLKLFHFWNRNSKLGSQRNIAAHYDLGNDFFETFLDDTMAYSSGYFTSDDESLEQASENKFDRLCQKLELNAQDNVLEIGSGWGGFACRAAKKYGCRVTTVTISQEQLEGARRRVAAEGLNDRVSVEFRDYRDIRGTYSKIASIEMIEAVGHEYYPVFLKQCMDLLREDGLLGLQAITIRDQNYHAARRNVDFIKRYIFPGGCLPSHTALCQVATKHTDLALNQVEDMTIHYAHTLARWRERFLANESRVAELGYPESFRRMWNFYLCYCQAGFEERLTGVSQLVFARPGYRGTL
jgi:cyclopropane-fatty-acyl-phospholipid synthase